MASATLIASVRETGGNCGSSCLPYDLVSCGTPPEGSTKQSTRTNGSSVTGGVPGRPVPWLLLILANDDGELVLPTFPESFPEGGESSGS